MEHQRIDPAARVWIVSRGPDGKLREELDPARVAKLNAAESTKIAGALAKAAGESDIGETRVW